MGTTEHTKRLLDLIEKSTSAYHTAEAARELLVEAGFTELFMKDSWTLERGGKYVVKQYGSGLFAFTVGRQAEASDGFRIGAAHGDFPGLHIKPNPEIFADGYVKLDVEGYGSVNLMSWLDRPLSVAGKVALRSENPFEPDVRLVDLKKPVLIIPNVAVHLDREMNKGMELTKQLHMQPIMGLAEKKEDIKDALKGMIAEELGVSAGDILDYELNIYNPEAGMVIGSGEEFLSAPRLDNLTSVEALVSGIEDSVRDRGINVIAVFDHEEIGSRTKQGAASTLLGILLEKIYGSLGFSDMEYKSALMNTLLMSVDVSHALHPAHESKYDPMNKNILNKGFSIKQACSQSYATDSEAIAVVQQICDKEGIAYQKFVNHSDQVGGSTLGNIASAMIPVRTVDMGVPLLAMHSSRELIGVKDQKSLADFLKAYYTI
ncbi:M18 family aminopeptidase [Bariatricus massiliensis]|uniref:M18 family aminopeptidase n=1 Tax=Bariatricus massiliensis TaxID=1745713 RepID=A0ABS8DFV6_9FIRM|nr:M18 family aminopeptidase [Bariatricus massiliensis]MCB7304181.1 M18 family aminopeptidase [Bariatricus massiliensis]MCB7374388.1 M18 family aminopeptidase [Bariatricus massiliensis]MCB7387291.1 M18 family aminopeptidase [Bariatricus massiliensis]MCB7411453.1 M18 family aminopeptidase [Bariatricus massiliensis]MCQ5252601.1 M18 family aminopeptidase [Bariatricus massiliensis]